MAWSLVGSDAVDFSDGGTGHSYTLPSGAPAAGSLDLLCVNSSTTVSVPAGFTPATSFVGNQGSYLWYRIAAGGEGATVTITTSGNFDTKLGWSRWVGAQAFDAAANAHVDSSSGGSTPAVSAGPLAGAGELVVAFAALHNTGAACTSPIWSAGYTPLTALASDIGTGAVGQFVSYRIDGTGTETPSVSWSTGGPFDRYILVAAFTPSAAVVAGPGQLTLTTAAASQTAATSASGSGSMTTSTASAALDTATGG
jgi:hypothetical protein